MSSFDKTMVLGYVGNEPVLKYTSTGQAVLNFNVAVNRFKGKGNPKQTIWYACAAWGPLAETLTQWTHKGDSIYLEGELTPRLYVAKDGKPAISNDFRIAEFHFMNSGDKQESPEVRQEEPAEMPF